MNVFKAFTILFLLSSAAVHQTAYAMTRTKTAPKQSKLVRAAKWVLVTTALLTQQASGQSVEVSQNCHTIKATAHFGTTFVIPGCEVGLGLLKEPDYFKGLMIAKIINEEINAHQPYDHLKTYQKFTRFELQEAPCKNQQHPIDCWQAQVEREHTNKP